MNAPSIQSSESQRALIRRRFARHKIAVGALVTLVLLYIVALGAEFFAPYPAQWRDIKHAYCPPQPPRFSFNHGLHVYAVKQHVDPITYRKTDIEDPTDIVPLGFFVKGEPYSFWGLFEWNRHFFGVNYARYRAPAGGGGLMPTFYLVGADQFGRDLFSRIVAGARISLSVGLISIVVTFVIGISVGGLSGYVGGKLDTFIQRVMEIFNSFPHLPLWLGLAAAMPAE